MTSDPPDPIAAAAARYKRDNDRPEPTWCEYDYVLRSVLFRFGVPR